MGIFVTALLVCKFLLIFLPGKEFLCKILQFSVYVNVQDLSVFYIDFVSDSVLKEFDLCIRGAFPEIETNITGCQSLACSHKSQRCVSHSVGGGGTGGREGYGKWERKGREAEVLRGREAGEKCTTLIF